MLTGAMADNSERRKLLTNIMAAAKRLDALQAELEELSDDEEEEDDAATVVDLAARHSSSSPSSRGETDEKTLPFVRGSRKRGRKGPAPVSRPPRPITRIDDSPGLMLAVPAPRVSLEGTEIIHAVSFDDFEERYTPGDLLGEGGMGEVRAHHDVRIGRDVAIKSLLLEVRDSSRHRERFLFEARVQGQLEHPGVVPVYEIGKLDDGSEYLSMKRLTGQTLRKVINDLRAGDRATMAQFSRRKLLSTFQSLCMAVDYAHQSGVVHRDIKPTNIMLGDYGEVYLLDWGVAKLIEAENKRGGSALDLERSHDKTEVGEVLGTPGYMSPEQATGTGLVDQRSDVFSLGAILFELLTLERLVPYQEGDLTELTLLGGYDAHISERFPEIDVPLELEQICVDATQHDPDDRSTSARAMNDAIERFVEGEGDAKRRQSMSRKHTRAAIRALSQARGVGEDGREVVPPPDEQAEHRRRAIQEAQKALALDPNNTVALQTMMRVMTDAPTDPSPDALRALRTAEHTSLRLTSRRGAVGYFIVVANLGMAAALGVRNVAMFALPLALLLGASALSLIASRQAAPDRRFAFPAIALASAGFALTGSMFGPFVVTPLLCAVHVVLVAVLLDRSIRTFAVVCSALAVFIPLGLQISGVVDASWIFRDGVVEIVPRVLELPETATVAFLVTVLVGAVVLPPLLIGPERDARVAQGQKLTLQAYQMAEFLPAEARETFPSLAPMDTAPPAGPSDEPAPPQ